LPISHPDTRGGADPRPTIRWRHSRNGRRGRVGRPGRVEHHVHPVVGGVERLGGKPSGSVLIYAVLALAVAHRMQWGTIGTAGVEIVDVRRIEADAGVIRGDVQG